MISTQHTKYREEVLFLANNYKVFTSDLLWALLLYNGKAIPKDKTDMARILSSYASQKVIAKTNIFRRSDLLTNNNIPRMAWTKYGRHIK
ncbi:hypothetical protein CMI37_25100 [Candidatus Pacearchaeota archaeon]|nr:hypothetical protein [Candidatus Pacearchaeota archaeon]|tara:strand:- start:5672 stop:5941 length:270 start_codon:yes stop_codon:yes gene_type:complete